MQLKRKYFILMTIIFVFSVHTLFFAEDGYYEINKLISLFELDFDYDQLFGSLTLRKNDKSVKISLDSSYILLGNEQHFINKYVKSENGQILVPENVVDKICGYLDVKKNIVDKKEKIIKKNGDDYYLDISRDKPYNLTKKDAEDGLDEDGYKNDVTDDKIDVKDKYIYDKKPENIKINAIIIDPGHGGQDPGAVGYSGTKEKDIVLKTSLILADKLKRLYPDKKIVLTRDSDVFPPLDKRSNIANYVFNKYGNSLFVSVHVNASPSSKPYGFETWCLIEEYRRKIIKKGEVSSDSDVENVLNSMLNDEIYKESKELALLIQKSLNKQIGNISKDRGIKEETYFVIKKSIMPAVLVEIGFNTNKYEEIRLTKYSYLNKIADGIFEGINEFIDNYEKSDGYTK